MTATGTLLEFFAAIEECERGYAVSRWNINGVPTWPFVRVEGRSEILQNHPPGGIHRSFMSRGIQLARSIGSPLLSPLENIQDWKHETLRLPSVDALFLGDGISQDLIEGAWRDRFCAPLIEEFEKSGATTLLTQPRAQKLPRERSAYSVHWVDLWGRMLARTRRARDVELPDYAAVQAVFRDRGFDLNTLKQPQLERWAVRVATMARLVDHILARTQPKIGLSVSYYWEIGFAFNLACRRRGILSVDIQHGAQDGRHEAYNLWHSMPMDGYSILPAIFWTWTEEDAQAINAWADRMEKPWHRALWGGHPQLAEWLNDSSARVREFDLSIANIKQQSDGTFDILVALQDNRLYSAVWDSLADLILSSPSHWRWWLRRHPARAYDGGTGLKRLLTINKPNVLIEQASSFPLPALLRNADAVLSLMSSTAIEASFFGHRPIFLTEDARMQFSQVFEADKADVITDPTLLMARLTELSRGGEKSLQGYRPPNLQDTAHKLFDFARSYPL